MGPRRTSPLVGHRVVDHHPGLAQHRHRHRDVRGGRNRRAGVHQRQAGAEGRSGQQQAGDELRGRRGVDVDRAASHRPVPADQERQPGALDVDAESAQCVEQRGDGPGPGLVVAVELDGRGAQCGQRRDEPQHRAGQSAVDAGAGGGGHGAADSEVGAPTDDVEAEGLQRADHQVGVAAAQRTDDGGAAVSLSRGQRRQDQGAVGLRLRARHRDRGVHGTRCPGCRPQLGAHGYILPCRPAGWTRGAGVRPWPYPAVPLPPAAPLPPVAPVAPVPVGVPGCPPLGSVTVPPEPAAPPGDPPLPPWPPLGP